MCGKVFTFAAVLFSSYMNKGKALTRGDVIVMRSYAFCARLPGSSNCHGP